MAVRIIWTPQAENQLKLLLIYLEAHWSEKANRTFINKLESRIKLITNYPELYRKSDRYVGARECLITKHTTLFYTLQESTLYIVTIWDNRQDPSKLDEK